MEQSEKTNIITGKSLFLQQPEEFLSLQEQAQAGDVTAQYIVGICHLYGQNTKVDYNKALQCFEKAAQQGDNLAGLFLGYFYEAGIGRSVNYTQAINKYMTYSPSISVVDKTALWETAKKLDEKEIEQKLSEIYNKASKIVETILNIKGFCVYYPNDNSFNFEWNDNTRSELKQSLDEYNRLVEEFKVYLDAYTSDTDDEKYGYWIYIYEDILNLTYETCNALVGRDSLFCYLDKAGLPAIEKNKNFEFALGRCLIDDNDDTDNDYIISGLLLVAGHDEDPIWQNKVGLWYEFRNENKDLVQAESWYKKAAALKLPAAEVNIERLKGEKEYKLITDKTEGSSEDRLKIVKSIRGNEELRNKWLLSAATLGNENATEQLYATIDVKGNYIYNKACNFEPSWKRIESEQDECKKRIDAWKQIVKSNRKKNIEEETRRIKEEEARRKAAEEEERLRQAELEVKALYEEEEGKSMPWLWVLVALLIAGGIGAWWYMNNENNNSSSLPVSETVVADTIPISSEMEETNDLPSSPLAFLEQFYKEFGDDGYLEQHVTANVLNKLKRDYEYDCPAGDCLATWVFEAYPPGADLELDEGPIISSTDKKGRYKVDFKYSYYNGEQKGYETRSVYLTVTEIDGKYLISDYEEVRSENREAERVTQETNISSDYVDSKEESTLDTKSQVYNESNASKAEDMYVYSNVEQMPSFPGGQGAMMQWISGNTRYPAIAAENGVQGRVVVQFVVEKDGTISDVHVINPVDPSLDREALRVIRAMPRWIPGKRNGSAVRVKNTVPVIFKL